MLLFLKKLNKINKINIFFGFIMKELLRFFFHTLKKIIINMLKGIFLIN